jgi:hypothetical protein
LALAPGLRIGALRFQSPCEQAVDAAVDSLSAGSNDELSGRSA